MDWFQAQALEVCGDWLEAQLLDPVGIHGRGEKIAHLTLGQAGRAG